jgi:hypothetical protein
MSPKQRLKFVCVLVLAISLAAFAKDKERDWQAGTLRDSSRSRYFAGTVGNANSNGSVGDNGSFNGSTNSSETAIYRVYQNYEIEGDQYVYLAQEHIRWRWSKAADVAVNEKIKFAVDKRKLYVLDDEGKEHEMEIVKRILKQPNPPAQ